MTDIPTPSSNRIWALLIGINSYESLAVRELFGCVNDVTEMRRLLVDRMLVPDEHIVVLTDESATRAAILATFESHLLHNDRIQVGDQILFQFSGHGSQMPSRLPDEPDGLDETILPYDTRTDGVFDIPDKTLAGLLRALSNTKGNNITVLLDCCHSGSGTRGLDDTPPNTRNAPADVRLPPANLDATYYGQGGADAARGAPASGWHIAQPTHVLLAGCHASELSHEHNIWEQPHGALTFFTLDYLRTLPANATYLDLHEDVASRVNRIYNTQMPQCEGDRTRLIFGGTRVEHDSFIRVRDVNGGVLMLDSGLVHGVMAGTELAIYPPTLKTRQQAQTSTPIASARVTQARATTAQAVFVGQPNDVPPNSRAIVTRQAIAGVKQTVAFEPVLAGTPSAELDRLVKMASAFRLLERIPNWHMAVGHALRGDPRNPTGHAAEGVPYTNQESALEEVKAAKDATTANLLVRASAEGLHILGEDGSELTSASATAEEAAGKLESIAQFRMVQQLKNTSSSAICSQIKLELRRYEAGKAPIDMQLIERTAGGEFILLHKDDEDNEDSDLNRYVLGVRNESAKPVYINLLYLESTFAIAPLYPIDHAPDAIPKDGRWFYGIADSHMPLMIGLKDGEDSTRDCIKLIATTSFTNLDVLRQDGLQPRSAARGDGNDERDADESSPLGQLIEALASGRRTLLSSKTPRQDDWATADLCFQVSRKSKTVELKAGQVSADLGRLHVTKPAGFVGTLTASTFEQAARSADAVSPPPALMRAPQTYTPIAEFTGRSIGQTGMVLTLDVDETSRASVTEATPLQLDVSAIEPGASDVMAVAFDGKDYLLVGQSDDAQPAVVPITALPLGRTLNRLKLFLFKKMDRDTPDVVTAKHAFR